MAGSISVGQGAIVLVRASDGGSIEVAGSISVGQGASLTVDFLGTCGQILIHGSVAASNPQRIHFVTLFGCTLRVDGSISIRGASDFVTFVGISVGGSVALRDNPASGVEISASSIDGSVTVRNNNVGTVTVGSNSIGGSVNFSNNVGSLLSIANNTIDNSLSCSGNSGSSVETFAPNTVGGSASGQCAI